MSNRIQQAVMMGLLIAIGVGAGACLSSLGTPCGDGWCPDGFFCTPADQVCVKSGCGNGLIEAGEECDDGNLADTDGCLSTCQLNRCGDGKVNVGTEDCDDGNTNNGDGCNNDCIGSLSKYVKASNTDAGDSFGNSIALSADGSTLAIGAPFEDSAATGIGGDQTHNFAMDAGAVYVFTRRNAGWSQQAYIKASNTGAWNYFGSSVALSADGSTLAVGAIGESSAATGIDGNQVDIFARDAGAVYVFTRSGTAWSRRAYVKASNTDAYDQFGYSVALSADGSTLAVGAPREASAATGINGDQANESALVAGAVYMFTRSGAVWSQQAYVKASNTGADDQFGFTVALSADGSILAVGAIGESSRATSIGGDQADNSAPGAGVAYVFMRSGTTWSQQAYVKASITDAHDHFGSVVALSAEGSTLAVGAPGEASAATGIDGDQADNTAAQAGAVYVFTRSITTWSQQAYVKASNTDPGDQFGRNVALSADGSNLAVGAIGEYSRATGIGGDQADNSADQAGAIYAFTRSGATWNQQAYVKASNTGADDEFGSSVALSADGWTLAVGAPGEASAAIGSGGKQNNNSAPHAGAAYVYRLP